MLVGFVHHIEALRRESRRQLFRDAIAGGHGVRIRLAFFVTRWVNATDARRTAIRQSQDLKV